LGPLLKGAIAVPNPARPLTAKDTGAYQFPNPPQEVAGLRYQVHLSGQEVFSFTGNRLSLRKKKLGLLSFGLLNELHIDDGAFVVRQPALAKGKAIDQPTSPPALAGLANLEGLGALFPVAKVIGMTCQPLRLTFDHGEPDQRVAITAKRATIGSGRQGLHLEGGVTLRTGDSLLTCGRLEIDAKGANIVARDYQLVRLEGTRHGQELRSDIFLQALAKEI